ncbi:xylulose kinase [Peptococcaceae bacterium CEB3]|nr:xylulose kinase [Peptococcaceae bacterium CEB3]
MSEMSEGKIKAMKRYVIGIDIGTSGCKSIIVDETGRIVATYTVGYSLYAPRTGWMEQNPEDWWNAVIYSVGEVLKESQIDKNLLAGIGLSGQMHGLVALDGNDNVLRPAILWNDQRTTKQCEYITDAVGGMGKLLSLTNNPELTGYTAGKILWLREEEPEVYEKVKRCLNPKDYIRYKLTSEFATDVSDASGTGLFNVKKRCWSEEVLYALKIPCTLLPLVYESSEITGYITESASRHTGVPKGLPVVGGGGDAVIQTTGTGLIKQGMLSTTIGTAGIVAMALNVFKQNREGNLQIFCGNKADAWHVMGVTLAAGGSYRWCRDVLFSNEKARSPETGENIYEIMESYALRGSPGSNRLIFLPYLTGERCPYADETARGVFIGLTSRHGREDMTRAVMEGVVFSLRQVSEIISKADRNLVASEIRTSGGGSLSPLWRQIQADVFQMPVKTVSGSGEGGAFGAALVAGVGCHIWNSLEEAVGKLKVETENLPNESLKDLYEDIYRVYDSLYLKLRDTFEKLDAII